MQNDRLAQIAARENAATPGPWYQVDTPFGDGTTVQAGNEDCSGTYICGNEPFMGEEREEETVLDNMAFIAHAREDISFLLATIAQLQEAARWVSVSERLPKRTRVDLNDPVICALDNGEVAEGEYSPVRKRWFVNGAELNDNGWAKVTHWIPLPKPPRAEAREVSDGVPST